MPTLDKYKGTFTFTDTLTTNYPKYGYVADDIYEYYVFPEENKCFVLTTNSIPQGNTVQSISSYFGLSALNGNYYQISTGRTDYIKGSETADSPIPSPYPNKPGNGYNEKDGYYYEYYRSSEDETYVWNQYPLISTQVTKYRWDKYNANYQWNRFNYTYKDYVSLDGNLTAVLRVAPSSFGKFEMTFGMEINGQRYNITTARNNKSGTYTYNGYSVGQATFYAVGFDGQSILPLYITNGDKFNYKIVYEQYYGDYYLTTLFISSTSEPVVDRTTSEPVTDISDDIYPDGKVQGNYYYEKANPFKIVGTLIDPTINSLIPNEYPNNDWQGDFYYISKASEIITKEDIDWDTVNEVESPDRGAYPYPNGNRDGYHYEFNTVRVTNREKDQPYGDPVESGDEGAFPKDGMKPGDPNYYWYVYLGNFPTYTQGELYELDVRDVNEDRYPNNDRDEDDGYWYVYHNPRTIPDKGVLLDPVSDYYSQKYPENNEQDGTWYVKRAESTIEDIPDILNGELFGGVTVNKQCNQNGDLQFGMTAGSSITFTVDNSNSRDIAYLEAKLYHYVQFNNESDYKLQGTYIIKDVVINDNKATFTAYDSLYLLDQNADNFINSNMSSNIQISSLISKIARQLGCSIGSISNTIPNRLTNVNKNNIQGKNITYRQLMQWALELLNCFLMCDSNGVWNIKQYSINDVTLTDSDYCNLTISAYAIPKATKVIENYYGKTSGNNESLYLINNNDLINENNAQTIVNNIMSNLNNMSEYYSASCKLLTDSFNNSTIDIGDIITIRLHGVNHTVYVMSKTIQQDGVYIECFGNSKRQSVFDPSTMKLQQVQAVANNAQISADNAMAKAEQVERNAITIDTVNGLISGKVSFANLQEAGQTTINGANIITGTIEANKINLNGLYGGTIQPVGTAYTQGVKMHVSDVRGDTDVICQQGTAMLRVDSNYVSIDRTGIILSFGGHNLTITSAGVKVDGRAI